jgi:uncharacterized protein YbaR (Trm112 family)
MPDDESQPSAFDPSIVDLLACPACHGDLRLEGVELLCSVRGHRYSIVDGIPVLIAERDEARA